MSNIVTLDFLRNCFRIAFGTGRTNPYHGWPGEDQSAHSKRIRVRHSRSDGGVDDAQVLEGGSTTSGLGRISLVGSGSPVLGIEATTQRNFGGKY